MTVEHSPPNIAALRHRLHVEEVANFGPVLRVLVHSHNGPDYWAWLTALDAEQAQAWRIALESDCASVHTTPEAVSGARQIASTFWPPGYHSTREVVEAFTLLAERLMAAAREAGVLEGKAELAQDMLDLNVASDGGEADDEELWKRLNAAIQAKRGGWERPFRVGDTVEIEGGTTGVLVEINPARVDDRYKVWLGSGHARERAEVWRPGTRPKT